MEIAESTAIRCSAIVLRDDRVLLCHRRGDDHWVLPGGTPHRAEGAAECAQREVLQETSIATTPVGIAFVFDVTGAKGTPHLFEIAFLAHERDPNAEPLSNEHDLDPCFVPIGSLGPLPLYPPIGDAIADLRSNVEKAPLAPYLGNLLTR